MGSITVCPVHIFPPPAELLVCYQPHSLEVMPGQKSIYETFLFWSHRPRDIGYTAVIFLPESMYITLDSSTCTSYPSLKRHKCLWQFGKATGLHELSSFLLSQSFFSSHKWLKSGITKKPVVVLHLSLLSISPLSHIFCTLSSLIPGVENFCRTAI